MISPIFFNLTKRCKWRQQRADADLSFTVKIQHHIKELYFLILICIVFSHVFNCDIPLFQTLMDDADNCRRKMNNAEALINGLSGEKTRWTEASKLFDAQIKRLVGDVLLATGFLSYTGPFNQEFRNLILKTWKKEMIQSKIPFSEVNYMDIWQRFCTILVLKGREKESVVWSILTYASKMYILIKLSLYGSLIYLYSFFFQKLYFFLFITR